MSFDWQTIVTFLIIGVSATYVARRFYRSVWPTKGSGISSCGHCRGCTPQNLVTLKAK
jgi:hypothetical protein